MHGQSGAGLPQHPSDWHCPPPTYGMAAWGAPPHPPTCQVWPLASHPAWAWRPGLLRGGPAPPPAPRPAGSGPPPHPPPTPSPCTRRRRRGRPQSPTAASRSEGRRARGDGPESLTVLLWRCGHVQYSAWQYQLSTKTPSPHPPSPHSRLDVAKTTFQAGQTCMHICEHLHRAGVRSEAPRRQQHVPRGEGGPLTAAASHHPPG